MAATLDAISVPPHLFVQDDDHTEVIELGEALLLGREATCDVVLDHPWVAPHHVRIEALGGAHQLVVLDAPAESLILSGRPVIDAVLQDGDLIRLTDPLTGGFVSLTYRNPLAPPVAELQHFATPPGQPLLTIGRTGADICLDQPLVSRTHAALLWRDQRHVLVDKNSAFGTFVNGTRVTEPRPLEPGDVVQIGTFRLTYDGDSLDSFDEHGNIRLDARELRRVVGRGDRQVTILHDTTLSVEPCEFIALVGGSGAGKSTLLKALCGFQPATRGTVKINGDDLYTSFDAYRSSIGYVPQDDILHRTLTVSRALYYTAQLRLPADTKPEELTQRINHALDEVDMLEHRHKRIDTLSGGQRKRVSIASELLADPVLLFLDEPTSGLDPGLERKMMFTLRKLADSGRIVILVTHATANIGQCDHIAFMAAGRVVFFGPPFQALEFFNADTFADIYTKTEGVVTDDAAFVERDLADDAAAWREAHPNDATPPPLAELWQARFATSLQHDKYMTERAARAPASPTTASDAPRRPRDRSVRTHVRQFRLLTQRYLALILSDRRNLALLLLQAPIIGVLLMFVAQDDSLTTGGRFAAKKVTFMMAMIGVWFGVINATREICKEAPITRREHLAGLFLSTYLASKVAVLMALVALQSALLLGVIAIKVTLPSTTLCLPAALDYFVTLSLAGLAGLALGLVISALSSTPDKATSLMPIVLVPQVLFAGLMFRTQGFTEWLSWTTAGRWTMDALGAISHTNQMPERIPLPNEPQYAATLTNLFGAWGGLVAQAIVWFLIAWLVLHWRAQRP